MKWEQAWLDYKPLASYQSRDYFTKLTVRARGKCIDTAVTELTKACKEILNIEIEAVDEYASEGILLTVQETDELGEEGYKIAEKLGLITVSGSGEVGVLYGVFELIKQVKLGNALKDIKISTKPDNPIRILNHWDNMDGSIERGYSGDSFFFEDDTIIVNDRTVDYARLVASIGINAVVINNVNVRHAAKYLVDQRYYEGLGAIGDIFAGYGIDLYISLNFAAPISVGGLSTADPLDEKVSEWWKNQLARLHDAVPNLKGFLVKADSEGEPGPFTYNRDHADGANMLARAVKSFGGKIIWRCFVYNCQQDWRDLKTDRARAGYDNFLPLDGKFDDNVTLQIKNGPMDFQVREPVSPLIGAMPKTNQILEVQIAQEYTGQQKHICYLIPMFKEILGFRTYCHESQDTVADVISGRTYNQRQVGIAAVVNTGNDANWTGHDFAAANLYGFGRLAWNMSLTSEAIANEWSRMTFNGSDIVTENVTDILMKSWPAYEKYTSPLGIGWMVNPSHHFGPNVDGYEYDRWGTYHRATFETIGVDRTPNGTGYTTQYNEPNAGMYEELTSCPEELLLFFHKVPYIHQLSTGKTVIQHIYDTHFEGVEEVASMIESWDEVEEHIDSVVHDRVKQRMQFQMAHAKEWRDVVNTYFYRKTGIVDAQKRLIHS